MLQEVKPICSSVETRDAVTQADGSAGSFRVLQLYLVNGCSPVLPLLLEKNENENVLSDPVCDSFQCRWLEVRGERIVVEPRDLSLLRGTDRVEPRRDSCKESQYNAVSLVNEAVEDLPMII